MVKVGREVMDRKGLCFTCHTIGKSGALRFPDLAGVGERAKTRVPGLSDVEYFAQTLYDPNAFIVPGFNPGMPVINKPPIGLTDQEILCVIAYLQSLGGKPTVTLQTSHHFYTPAVRRRRRPRQLRQVQPARRCSRLRRAPTRRRCRSGCRSHTRSRLRASDASGRSAAAPPAPSREGASLQPVRRRSARRAVEP